MLALPPSESMAVSKMGSVRNQTQSINLGQVALTKDAAAESPMKGDSQTQVI